MLPKLRSVAVGTGGSSTPAYPTTGGLVGHLHTHTAQRHRTSTPTAKMTMATVPNDSPNDDWGLHGRPEGGRGYPRPCSDGRVNKRGRCDPIDDAEATHGPYNDGRRPPAALVTGNSDAGPADAGGGAARRVGGPRDEDGGA